MKKMPLGKLSHRQMRSAYSVLTELQQELEGGASPARILDASNRSVCVCEVCVCVAGVVCVQVLHSHSS